MAEKVVYTYEDVRRHRRPNDAWIAVHGKVYDITNFIPRHPAGNIILTGLGRDATALFESHHNLVDNIDAIYKTMAKYEIGTIKDYVPVAKFDSPFAKEMLQRVKEMIKGYHHRDSFYSYSALAFFYIVFGSLIYAAFKTGSFWLCPFIGALMAVGHLAGHAGNHWSVSAYDWVNKFVSVTCTSLWGLREKYWEFSHLISHHCYNYTDRDYVMEQHVPTQYFRVREEDPWRPIHAYQPYIYMTTPFTAFFLGALRLDCAPWIVFSPFLSSLRRNHDSPAPAPQFFCSGSNVEESELKSFEDGVGDAKVLKEDQHFLIFDTTWDNIFSILLSNVIWAPLFFYNWKVRGFWTAVLFNSMSFGWQAVFVTRNLFTQHICEDIKLSTHYAPTDDWYQKQLEASTSVNKLPVVQWLTFAIAAQIEHHLFPALNPLLLVKVQPLIKEIADKHGLQYKYFESDSAAYKSVYAQFVKMSKKPNAKKE